jgi:hypothetical protein
VQVQSEKERIAQEYESALVDLNNEFGERLATAAGVIDGLKQQVPCAGETVPFVYLPLDH